MAHRRHYVRAVECLRQAMALDGEDDYSLTLVASYLRCAGGEEDALEAAERALELDAQAYLALEIAAKLHARRGDHERGKAYTLRCINREPLPSHWLIRITYHGLRALSALPWFRGRVDKQELQKLKDPGLYKRDFDTWAHQYLAWLSGNAQEPGDEVVH